MSAFRGYSDGALGIVLLNTGDDVLVMLSNDADEFGVRFVKERSMRTLRALWLVISALCLTSWPVSAAEAEIEPGTVSARQFTTLAVYAATFGLPNAMPREKLKAFYICLDEQKRPRLALLYLQLFKERFTTDELRVVDRFQATVAADKLQQYAIYKIQQESPNSFAADLGMDRPDSDSRTHMCMSSADRLR